MAKTSWQDKYYYNKGMIYMLTSKKTDKVYIGSCIYSLDKLFGELKGYYRRWSQGAPSSGYCSAYEILKYDDCRIELVESYPSENRKQLHSREGEVMRKMKSKLVNIQIP